MSFPHELRKNIVIFASSGISLIIFVIILSTPLMGMFALGPIVSPGGVFDSTYSSTYRSETITISGINDTITIKRDIWGIPHIYGTSWTDVVFALGYCHAYDRLFQMDMITRTGMGRMAEILGNSSLEDDIFYQTLGIEKAAQEMIDQFEIERQTNYNLDRSLKMLDSYTAGVNYMIKKFINTKSLPIEFRLLGYQPTLWTILKIFVYNKLMSLMLTYSTTDIQATILRDELFGGNETLMNEIYPINNTYYQIPVIPSYGNFSNPLTASNFEKPNFLAGFNNRSENLKKILENQPESIKYFQNSWIGSNNWVVNGSKTVTGKPILANDMHLSIALPHIWYEVHLVSEEENLNIYGYTLTGTPAVIVGYNTHVAWGFTNVINDAVDWYEYKWNGEKYWSGLENQWKSLTERKISIPVKGGKNFNTSIFYTEDGVVMSDVHKKSMIAMKWTATQEPTYEILALMGANLAHNWSEFNESIQYFKDPTQNIVFADSDGNIALRPTGRFIKRSFFGEGLFIINGSDPAINKDWEYIPFNELPLAFNPSQMYLASANQKSTGPDYPYYISSAQAPGYRGRAINYILANAPLNSIDVDFMKDAQCGKAGIFDTAAEAFTPYIISAVQGQSLSTIDSEALSLLNNWHTSENKYLMDKSIVGPTIYYQTQSRLKEYVWNDEFQAAGGLAGITRPQDNILEYLVKTSPNSPWFDDVSTVEVEDRDDCLLKAYKKAILDLQAEFGDDPTQWVWGKYHRMFFNHLGGIDPFGADSEGYPHDGSGYTLLAAEGRRVKGGPSERMIIDFSNLTNCWSVIPGGVSGNPASSHYMDQALDLWLKGEYHSMLIHFSTPELFTKEYLEATLILKPA